MHSLRAAQSFIVAAVVFPLFPRFNEAMNRDPKRPFTKRAQSERPPRPPQGRSATQRPGVKGPASGKLAGPAPANPPTAWEDAAGWYDRLVGDAGSEYHRHVVLPGVVRLLAPKAGEPILDVACGQGVLCRLLRDRGAEVTGVDMAGSLVRAARERGPASIRYHAGDARDLGFLPPVSFASAACVLAIQNIHPIGPVFRGVHRVLRLGGRFVIVMMHPAFRGPRETKWQWEKDNAVQYRRVDRYLLPRKTPIVTHPGSAPDGYTWTFHKPIESYVKALRNAGLLIDAMEEWPSHKSSEPGPRAAAENTARREIPMFLAIRAVKVAGFGPLAVTEEPG